MGVRIMEVSLIQRSVIERFYCIYREVASKISLVMPWRINKLYNLTRTYVLLIKFILEHT